MVNKHNIRSTTFKTQQKTPRHFWRGAMVGQVGLTKDNVMTPCNAIAHGRMVG
jgi:hypothetical protein